MHHAYIWGEGEDSRREYKLQTCWVGSILDVEQKKSCVIKGSCPRGSIIRDKTKEAAMRLGSLGPSNHWKDFRFYCGGDWETLEGFQASGGMICLKL